MHRGMLRCLLHGPLLLASCAEPIPSAAPSPSPIEVAIAHQPGISDATLIDLRADGAAIWGRPRPAPARATALPLFDAWLATEAGGEVALPVVDGAVRDARLGPAGTSWIALLDRDHVLWLWDPGNRERLEVTADGFPGMSFSRDGRTLVYAAGPRPVLDLFVFDLERRASRQVTDFGAPLALPAFDDSGETIVFASAFRGVPALWLVRVDGTGLRQLTNREITAADFRAGHMGVPMPEGLRPPLWRKAELVFEAEGAVFGVSEDGDLRWTVERADLPHFGRDGRLWVRTDGGPRPVPGAAR